MREIRIFIFNCFIALKVKPQDKVFSYAALDFWIHLLLCKTETVLPRSVSQERTLHESCYMMVRNGCAILVASEMWSEATVALITSLPQHDGLNLAIVTIFCETGICCPFL